VRYFTSDDFITLTKEDNNQHGNFSFWLFNLAIGVVKIVCFLETESQVVYFLV